MRRVVHAAALSLFVGLFVTGPAVAAPYEVKLEGNQFKPRSIQVTEGSKVTWKDVEPDDRPHTVTAHAGQAESFDSHPSGCPPLCMGQGDTFEHTFNKAGTFTYYCKIHGDAGDPNCAGMCGKVVVKQEPAGGGQVATQTPAPVQTAAPAVQAPSADAPEATPTPTPTASAEPAERSTAEPTATVLAVEETSESGGRSTLIGLAVAAVLLAGGAGVYFGRLRPSPRRSGP